ncbi:SYTL2 protein, partial [Rissa tridactyla]|nr:SYTL2 protein [Rissa tridactyla]
RHLPEKVKDDVQLKNMSGQWFYEAKSKRHRDKIHGADIIRASMRRKPATLAEVSQNKPNKAKNSWVSNVNKEVFVSPELHGIVEHQEEEELKSSSSSKTITAVLDKPEERSLKAAVSPVKPRRNPFNSTAPGDNLNSEESENRPATLPQLSKKEILSLSEESQPKPNLQNDETEKHKKPSVEATDESQKGLAKRPVPKARKLIHKATDPVSEREHFVPKPAKRTERINGVGTPPRGILKRSSSSSSTDSEVRVSQMLDVQKKNALPTATIFEGEAEKNSLTEEVEDSTQISLEKLKQVRFSSSTGDGDPLQSPQLHHGRVKGEFDLLESDKIESSENDAIRSNTFGNKQISAVKLSGTDSSALQVKTIGGLQDDTSASGPCATNRSDVLVNEALQTKTVTPKKLETAQQTSSNILPHSKNDLSVDETHENKANQFLSNKSKSHKNVTGKRLMRTIPLDINLPKEEVADTVDKVVLPKAELDVFKLGLKKLEKEASEMSSSLNLKENILEERTFRSDQCKISERTGEQSHDISPADQKEETSKSTGKVNVPSIDEHENKKSLRRLFREFEPFCLRYRAAEKDDTLGGLQRSQGGLQNLLGETCASQPSEHRRMEMKTSNDANTISQTNYSVDSTCQEDTGQPEEVNETTEKYVKTYLLPEKYKLGKRKTSVKKKTFNPVYNEILRYKIEKSLLKNQSLNISVWHNDTFGRNSFLGEVELDLGTWDWNDKSNKQINWLPLKPRTSTVALELQNRGEMKLALRYVPHPVGGKKTLSTGEVHIWVKECHDLPLLRGNRLNSFIKCTILPDTSRKSRQKTRTVAKTTNPVFNHTMVYDGFRPEDLKEACVELTVWDHNKLANHFLGGLRIGLGTGKSYGTTVDWMDSTADETGLWEKMINSPNTWVEDTLPLRMLMVAKLTK